MTIQPTPIVRDLLLITRLECRTNDEGVRDFRVHARIHVLNVLSRRFCQYCQINTATLDHVWPKFDSRSITCSSSLWRILQTEK